MKLLEIPSKEHADYDEAVETVVHSADVFRTLLAKIVNEGADPKQILKEHGELLTHAEIATLSWLKHLQKRKMN